MEQPPSALSWLQPDNIALLREWSARCAHVAACNHGVNVWAFCASFQSIAQLACACKHAPGSRQSIAGVQVQGQYLSSLTAEYPPSLASSLAQLMLPFVSQHGHCSASVLDFADFITEDFVPRRLRLCDGAGLNSTADTCEAWLMSSQNGFAKTTWCRQFFSVWHLGQNLTLELRPAARTCNDLSRTCDSFCQSRHSAASHPKSAL